MKLTDLIKENFILGDNLTKNSPSHAFSRIKEQEDMQQFGKSDLDKCSIGGTNPADLRELENHQKMDEGNQNYSGRTFQTYAAWKRALKGIDADVKFRGDKDIDSAYKKGHYDAEWDGESGGIQIIKENDLSKPHYQNYTIEERDFSKLPDPSTWGQQKLRENNNIKKEYKDIIFNVLTDIENKMSGALIRATNVSWDDIINLEPKAGDRVSIKLTDEGIGHIMEKFPTTYFKDVLSREHGIYNPESWNPIGIIDVVTQMYAQLRQDYSPELNLPRNRVKSRSDEEDIIDLLTSTIFTDWLSKLLKDLKNESNLGIYKKINENTNMKNKDLLNERMLGLAGIVPMQSIGFASNSPAQKVNEWGEHNDPHGELDLPKEIAYKIYNLALKGNSFSKSMQILKDDPQLDQSGPTALRDAWDAGNDDRLGKNPPSYFSGQVNEWEEEDLSQYDDDLNAIEDPRGNKTSRTGKFGKDSWDDDRYEKEDEIPSWEGGPPQDRGLSEDHFTPQNFPTEEANKNADLTKEYTTDLNGPIPVAKSGIDGHEFEVYFKDGVIDDVEVVSGDFTPNGQMTQQLLDRGQTLGDALLQSKGQLSVNENRIGKPHGKNLISERAMGILGMVPLQPIGIATNANIQPKKTRLYEVSSDLSRSELYKMLPMIHSSILMELAEHLLESSSGQGWDVIVEELTDEYLNNASAKKEITHTLKRCGVI